MTAQAALIVNDELNALTLQKPAQHIISLSPHLTENLFILGAQQQLLATIEGSDFPSEAKILPRIGSYSGLKLERIVQMKPDLIIAWKDGTSARDIAQLRRLGFLVWVSHPLSFNEVAAEFRTLGRLTGHEKKANILANEYEFQLKSTVLNDKIPNLKTFFQIGDQPIFTINRTTFIHQMLQNCHFENVFASAIQVSPQVSVEKVLMTQAQVIFSFNKKELTQWLYWENLPAVKKNHLYVLDPNDFSRPSLNLLKGVKTLCQLRAKLP
ncbi:MAG: cobalamin-binding protein [Neisseriaceae bacterium]|nr:cobalamin-binding protein [Neisseriaceae bacterium]